MWVQTYYCDKPQFTLDIHYVSHSHLQPPNLPFNTSHNMLSHASLLLTLLSLHVSAHGGCLNYTVGDTWYPG